MTSVKFTNPHGSPAVGVKNQDGSPSERVMTPGCATALAQRGIGPTGASALQSETRSNRDKIKVKFPPARHGNPPGFLKDRDHAGRARDPDLRR